MTLFICYDKYVLKYVQFNDKITELRFSFEKRSFFITKIKILDKQPYIYFLCSANIAKGESVFMTTYKKDSFERNIHNRIAKIVNLTPELSCGERKEVKKNIERKLYDVFCKYL